MKKHITNFVSECIVCQRVKRHHGKPYGLLLPLPIPNGPWGEISMDFITGLPTTSSHNDMIWTIVDRFSKQAYFIACRKTLNAPLVAKLFIKTVFTHHGLPRVIVSDRDSHFCNHFWLALFANLGSKIDFSSAFHPESNGQSEATNSTIMDLLRAYTIDRPSNWDEHLHILQFAYNNTPHSATGKAPFQVVYGKKLPTPTCRIGSQIPVADHFAQDHTTILKEVTKSIQQAQERYTKQVNKKRTAMQFKENDIVLLRIEKHRLKSIEKHPKVKLAPRFYGPFKIIQKINDNAFRLDIPSHWRIHNSFHISLLRPFRGSIPLHPIIDDPPLLEEDSEILVPESILDHDQTTTRTGTVYHRYLIKYKNHSIEEAQWIPESSLSAYQALITAYHSQLP